MKEISILIPSLRENAVKNSIIEFERTNPTVDYELVITSPFKVEGKNVVWVEEKTLKGSVFATHEAFLKSSGNYVVYFSDDVTPDMNCLYYMLEFMKANEKYNKLFLGAFKMVTDYDREIGPFAAYKKLYACYGCISKESVEKVGCVFDCNFKYSWCDIDLSLRVWEKEGLVAVCDEAKVIPHQIEDEIYKDHRNKYWNHDVNFFLDRWHSKLGEGLEKKDGAVNRKLR
jgi:hypothetical protein